jgi:hypothetical protein
MGCGSITRSELVNCPTPLIGGIAMTSGNKNRLVLYNFDEVSFTESATTPNLFTAITMATNCSGYQFEGYKASLKPSLDIVTGANSQNMLKHRLAFVVYSNTQLTKNNLQNLMQGRYVGLYENNGKNNNSFELMGVDVGVEVKPQKIRDLGENGAAYMMLLESPDTELETKFPHTFLSTNYATSLAAVNTSLCLPTVTTISDIALQVAGGDTETITGTKFYGSNGSASEVLLVEWENTVTKARTTQTAVTVVSDTSITFTSVALAAGTYRLIVTTTKGEGVSTQVATAS